MTVTECCSACGAELTAHETHCPICGKTTADYHHQRRCLHCGSPVAKQAKTCLMCGQPVDSLPLRTPFSGSWFSIIAGLLIIIVIVVAIISYQQSIDATRLAAQPRRNTPTATASPTITLTLPPTNTPGPSPTNTPSPTSTPSVHILQRGETLLYLAGLYGVTVKGLIEINKVKDVRNLQTGQKLLIPAPAPSQPGDKNPPPPQVVYVIEEGDTLIDIAIQHGTTIESIVAANPDVNLDLIFTGDELVVPLFTPTPTNTPTSTSTPTSTPAPPYSPPDLLSPPNEEIVTGSTLFFNWTAVGFLAKDEFYVLSLSWEDGSKSQYWGKSNSWRISKDERPSGGSIIWYVTVMRQTNITEDGSSTGIRITDINEQRTVDWP